MSFFTFTTAKLRIWTRVFKGQIRLLLNSDPDRRIRVLIWLFSSLTKKKFYWNISNTVKVFHSLQLFSIMNIARAKLIGCKAFWSNPVWGGSILCKISNPVFLKGRFRSISYGTQPSSYVDLLFLLIFGLSQCSMLIFVLQNLYIILI